MKGQRPRRAATENVLLVDGRELRVTNPDRVLYPVTGTTKLEVIDYYRRSAFASLPHLIGRPATRKRWPEGVDGEAFFSKEIDPGTPEWLPRVQVQHGGGPKFYPVFDSTAALAWLGQVSALELHVPQWRIEQAAGPTTATAASSRVPDRVVFDLDPGPGAGLAECVEVAFSLRERLGLLGKRIVPVTSGSKGLHLYVPMDDPITSAQATEWARLAAEELVKALPGLVVSKMARSLRAGRVFVDWHQNHDRKTTIAPYSLRGRDRPTVAAPRTWSELGAPGVRHLELHEVLDRLDQGLDPMTELFPFSLAAAVGAPEVSPRMTSRPAPIVVRSTLRELNPRATTELSKPLPAGLTGPVAVELARAEERVPGPHAMPGTSLYEAKWDGFRVVVAHGSGRIRLWSKNGSDLTMRFPEITSAAASVVPGGTVLDGEAVIWQHDRLDFDLLQRRFAGGLARIAQQAREHPASYMVFDLLALDGKDLRGRPLRERRAALELLAQSWAPPMQLSPVTADVELAKRWMVDYRPAGIEGLVVKGAGTRYEPNLRRWIKVRARESQELIVGAVTGSISQPTSIIGGLYRDGHLKMIGRSVPLNAAQSRSLAGILTPAGPEHPWPDTVVATRFGSGRDRVSITRVDPVVVAEVSVDTALQGGSLRHPVRFIRYRPDLTVDDLMPQGN